MMVRIMVMVIKVEKKKRRTNSDAVWIKVVNTRKDTVENISNPTKFGKIFISVALILSILHSCFPPVSTLTPPCSFFS